MRDSSVFTKFIIENCVEVLGYRFFPRDVSGICEVKKACSRAARVKIAVELNEKVGDHPPMPPKDSIGFSDLFVSIGHLGAGVLAIKKVPGS